MGKDVIVACDFSSAEKTFEFLGKFTGKKPFVKIGMELFYSEGPNICLLYTSGCDVGKAVACGLAEERNGS